MARPQNLAPYVPIGRRPPTYRYQDGYRRRTPVLDRLVERVGAAIASTVRFAENSKAKGDSGPTREHGIGSPFVIECGDRLRGSEMRGLARTLPPLEDKGSG